MYFWEPISQSRSIFSPAAICGYVMHLQEYLKPRNEKILQIVSHTVGECPAWFGYIVA